VTAYVPRFAGAPKRRTKRQLNGCKLPSESLLFGIFPYHFLGIVTKRDALPRRNEMTRHGFSAYISMIPRRTAMAIACVRSLAPSFSMMCLT
jgi:hypothetical protein